MSDPNVIVWDDAIPLHIQEEIENLCLSVNFPWHYHHTSTYPIDHEQPSYCSSNAVDTPFFSHILWDADGINSNFFGLFRHIAEAIPDIESYRLRRYKLNITMPQLDCNENTHSHPHVDLTGIGEDYLTAIYYITDSNGDTFIFNETEDHVGEVTVNQRITPKRGRLVIFNGKHLHAGNNPILGEKVRCVANINLQKKP
jgi:hypothetical protein